MTSYTIPCLHTDSQISMRDCGPHLWTATDEQRSYSSLISHCSHCHADSHQMRRTLLPINWVFSASARKNERISLRRAAPGAVLSSCSSLHLFLVLFPCDLLLRLRHSILWLFDVISRLWTETRVNILNSLDAVTKSMNDRSKWYFGICDLGQVVNLT